MAYQDPDVFVRLERFYDALPRSDARAEEFGGLVLFVREGPGWPFYARPRLHGDTPSAADIIAVRQRQRELGLPESFEWVHETTPDLLAIARSDLAPHIVRRELITLSGGAGHGKPVLGMFLGGAYLADTMLYCRHKLYPLGLPNWLAHALALLLGLLGVVLGRRASFLPPPPSALRVSGIKGGELNGKFAFLMVTTLQRLLFKGSMPGAGARTGAMQLLVIDRNLGALLAKRAAVTATSLRARPASEKAAIVAAVREHVWPLVSDGRVRPVVDRTVPMRNAADAHRIMEESSHVGKILLVP